MDVDGVESAIKHVEIWRKGQLENCGFHLTRGRWDPYPWVSDVDEGTAADEAGVRPGDCLLEVDGRNVVGWKIAEIADVVRTKTGAFTMRLWNAGVEPECTPEAICCGPMPTNLQRLSACMSTILAFLECPVCLDTIPPPTYQCDNGHMICIRCRSKSERCPVCRTRLSRGRSLLADQVYNALVDAFGLKDESDEDKSSRMRQIFKVKHKKSTIPDIRVTEESARQPPKFLAKLMGKSSSYDNLTVSDNAGTRLKTKSLSTIELFPMQSLSCHGSFESLQPPSEEACHCPFVARCPALLRPNDLIDHFRQYHNGPLVQYFASSVQINLSKIFKRKELSYVITTEGNTFYLKIQISESDDIFLWMWILGTKKASKMYEMHTKLFNDKSNDVVMSVQSSIHSLSVPYKDIYEMKKGVFFSTKSFDLNQIHSKNFYLDCTIVKCDIY